MTELQNGATITPSLLLLPLGQLGFSALILPGTQVYPLGEQIILTNCLTYSKRVRLNLSRLNLLPMTFIKP